MALGDVQLLSCFHCILNCLFMEITRSLLYNYKNIAKLIVANLSIHLLPAVQSRGSSS